MKDLKYVLPGILFGIVLTKSQVISWFRINSMFKFEESHMYLIICSAIAVGLVSYLLVKAFNIKDVKGKKIKISEREMNKGVIIGEQYSDLAEQLQAHAPIQSSPRSALENFRLCSHLSAPLPERFFTQD